MAEHRQLLMSRQLMLEAEEENRIEIKGDIYEDNDEGIAQKSNEIPHKASTASESNTTAEEDN